MKRVICLVMMCVLCLALTGCGKTAKLPFTKVELGMSMEKAQELEPDATAQMRENIKPSYISRLNALREYGGFPGDLSIGAKLVSETEAVVGQIGWFCQIYSSEKAALPDSSTSNSQTPGDDARALYQKLLDDISAGVGARPNQTTGEDHNDGSKFQLTNYWNIGDDVLVFCTLQFDPDFMGRSEAYQIKCVATYTLPR